MKYKAKLELDLTSGDILESEIKEAFRSYAKSVARESVQKDIKEEIESATKKWSGRLYDSTYTTSWVESRVKDITRDFIKNRLLQIDIIDIVQKSTDEAIKTQIKEFRKYIAAQFKTQIKSELITGVIRDEIHKQIPNAVLEALKANS